MPTASTPTRTRSPSTPTRPGPSTLVKTADIALYSTVGDPIDYTYTVTNTGNVTLTGPFTVDRRPGEP